MSLDSGERNLGYIAWKNDLSWMEAQKGARWDQLVREENRRFRNRLSKIKPLIKKMESELESDDTAEGEPYILNGWKIEGEEFKPEETWIHRESGFSCKCLDADYSEDMFVAAVQVKGGYERFMLEMYSMDSSTGDKKKQKPRHLKTIPNTGSQVAIFHGEVYFLHSNDPVRNSSLCKWTGNEVLTLFHLDNPEENLELERGEDGSVYVTKGDYTHKSYSLVNKIKWLRRPHLESCIVWDDMELDGITGTIESFSLKAGWTVTISRGIRTLWKEKEPIVWIWGDVSSDSRNPFRLDISDVRYEPYSIILPKWHISNPKPVPFPCSYYDSHLPVFVVHPKHTIKAAKGLLVTAYGAYGSPTQVGSLINQWKPLLLRGWIVAAVEVPGGGDDTRAWIKRGQRLKRLYSIELLAKAIKRLQEEHNIPSINTALYGRSAGGLLIASVAVRHPGLVRSLYIESPYLDILRTMTNPELALSTMETSEFGTSATDLITTAEWSPMEHIPEEGIPELVIARTDLADLKVMPYEPLKFIQRARGSSGGEKIIYVHRGRGHHTTNFRTRAEDLAILESSGLRIKNLGYKYKMSPTRKNAMMGGRRRTGRKNANNATMGGRRSNNRTRRGNRGHRGSRKH
jgi:pimeloyl-ACP methyl ester carboxylesterase